MDQPTAITQLRVGRGSIFVFTFAGASLDDLHRMAEPPSPAVEAIEKQGGIVIYASDDFSIAAYSVDDLNEDRLRKLRDLLNAVSLP